MSAKWAVTIVLAVNPDEEGYTPIEQAVRDALNSSVLHKDERIVSIKGSPTGKDPVLGPDSRSSYEQVARDVLSAYMGGNDEALRVALNRLEGICGFSQQTGS